jgi:protein-disulfide isomerase
MPESPENMSKIIRTHRSLVLLTIAMFATAVLAACGKRDSGDSAQAPTPAPAAQQEPAPPELTAEQAARLVRPHSPIVGPPNAPVTLVEFLDPACEGCRAFAPIVKQILFMHPEDVRLVVRFAAFHQGSDEAIRIIEAARQQGRFEEVLSALFDRQEEWASHHSPDIEAAWKIAADAGIDVERARRDARSKAADELLRIDEDDINALQVARTPTFFVNGRQPAVFGPRPLMELVAAEIAKAKATPAAAASN